MEFGSAESTTFEFRSTDDATFELGSVDGLSTFEICPPLETL